MGNSSSAGKSLEDVSIDSALDLLSSQPLWFVTNKLLQICKLTTEEGSLKVSKSIYARAVESSSNLRYVELAKNMSSIQVINADSHKSLTFYDVFIKHALSQFQNTRQWSLNMAIFLGNLYVNGLVSISVVAHWVKLLQDQRLVQDKILITIKHTIMNLTPESYGPDNDLGNYLKKLMAEKLIIIEEHVPSANTFERRELKTPTPLITSLPREIATPAAPLPRQFKASTTSSRQLSATQVIHPTDFSSPMTQTFKVFINNIHKPQKVEFNLRQLKSCDDITRRTCAKIMLDAAIANPDNCSQYAKLMRVIQCSDSGSFRCDKTFVIHLGGLCELEINKVFGHPDKKWMRITNIGIFLSHLYLQDYMKNALMNKWLDNNVQAAVDNKESVATRTLLISLKVIMNKMKLRDIKSYTLYTQHVKRLVAERRYPIDCEPWLKDILGNNYKQCGAALSTQSSTIPQGSMTAQSSTSAQNSTGVQGSTMTQISTGAIKKTTDGKPVSQPAASTRFYESLRDLLNGKSSSFDCTQLETCPEQTINGCALVLIEHATGQPKNAKLYAAITANAIISRLKSEARKKLVVKCLVHYFTEETKRCFKPGFPDKCLWGRINDVGAFLCELYNFDVIEGACMSSWIQSINAFLLHEAAIAAMLNVMTAVGRKMKERDPLYFVSYMDIGYMRSVIPNKYKELYDSVMELKMANAVPEASQASAASTSSATSTSEFSKEKFDQLKEILGKMKLGNHNQIIEEILALKIDDTKENLQKFLPMIVVMGARSGDLLECTCEILEQLPKRSTPPMVAADFKRLIVASIILTFEHCFSPSEPEYVSEKAFATLVKELHSRSIIGDEIVSEIFDNIFVLDNFTQTPEERATHNWFYVESIKAFGIAQPTITKRFDDMQERLKRYHENTDSPELRKGIEEALAILKSKETTRFSNAQHQPSTSSASSSDQNLKKQLKPQPTTSTASLNASNNDGMENVKQFFRNLKHKSAKELANFIEFLKLESKADMNAFSKVFVNVALKSHDMPVYAKLAQIMSQQLPTEEKVEEFKDSIVAETLESYCASLAPLGSREAPHHTELTVKFLGNLFNAGFFKSMSDLLINNIETIDGNGAVIIDSIRNLLEAISMTVIKNGDGESYKDCYKLLQTKKEYFKNAVEDLKYIESLEILEGMISFGNASQVKSNKAQIQAMVDAIKHENVNEIAEKIKALSLSYNDLESTIGIVLSRAVSDSDASSACSQLAREIQDLSANSSSEPKISLKEVLVESCQEMVLNNFKGDLRLGQLKETKNLLEFIGDLFLDDVFNINFIILCIELLIEDESNNAADCLSFFLQKTGSKVDSENETKLDEYFARFEAFTQEEYSYRSNAIKDLLNLRRNNWMPVCGNSDVQINDNSPGLKTIFNKISCRDMQEAMRSSNSFIDQSVGNQKQFIDVIWSSIISRPGQIQFLAKLCKNLSVDHQDFHESLIEFLKCRVIAFASVPKQKHSTASQMKLANVMIFIANLYVLDVVPEDNVEMLLKPVKLLPFDSVSTIISIIGPKISESENIRLKALMINLDELSHEGSLKFLRSLKDDIINLST